MYPNIRKRSGATTAVLNVINKGSLANLIPFPRSNMEVILRSPVCELTVLVKMRYQVNASEQQ